jgi:dTDP-4-dehydrorhamnose reductase
VRIAVTGASGQLGSELCLQLGPSVRALSRHELDFSDLSKIVPVLNEAHVDVIINCAAYTHVDQAEEAPAACQRVNGEAVRYLAAYCNEFGGKLVQISSDYVFDGQGKSGGYRENDPPNPRGVYATSKRMGETMAMSCRQHMIVRTCGLYGHLSDKPNFVRTIRRLGGERAELQVVDDQRCGPTYVPHLARAILYLLGQDAEGIFHIVNRGGCSWFEFARRILDLDGSSAVVRPITTQVFGAKAPRPRNSILCTDHYHEQGGPPMPPWDEALQEYFSKELPIHGK